MNMCVCVCVCVFKFKRRLLQPKCFMSTNNNKFIKF